MQIETCCPLRSNFSEHPSQKNWQTKSPNSSLFAQKTAHAPWCACLELWIGFIRKWWWWLLAGHLPEMNDLHCEEYNPSENYLSAFVEQMLSVRCHRENIENATVQSNRTYCGCRKRIINRFGFASRVEETVGGELMKYWPNFMRDVLLERRLRTGITDVNGNLRGRFGVLVKQNFNILL